MKFNLKRAFVVTPATHFQILHIVLSNYYTYPTKTLTHKAHGKTRQKHLRRNCAWDGISMKPAWLQSPVTVWFKWLWEVANSLCIQLCMAVCYFKFNSIWVLEHCCKHHFKIWHTFHPVWNTYDLYKLKCILFFYFLRRVKGKTY